MKQKNKDNVLRTFGKKILYLMISLQLFTFIAATSGFIILIVVFVGSSSYPVNEFQVESTPQKYDEPNQEEIVKNDSTVRACALMRSNGSAKVVELAPDALMEAIDRSIYNNSEVAFTKVRIRDTGEVEVSSGASNPRDVIVGLHIAKSTVSREVFVCPGGKTLVVHEKMRFNLEEGEFHIYENFITVGSRNEIHRIESEVIRGADSTSIWNFYYD